MSVCAALYTELARGGGGGGDPTTTADGSRVEGVRQGEGTDVSEYGKVRKIRERRREAGTVKRPRLLFSTDAHHFTIHIVDTVPCYSHSHNGAHTVDSGFVCLVIVRGLIRLRGTHVGLGAGENALSVKKEVKRVARG